MNFIEQFEPYSLPTLGWTRLPEPPITNIDREKYGIKSNSELLAKLTTIGLEEKLKNGIIPKDKIRQYIDRCQMELDTFNELHFTGYMLLVWKVIEKAKELGVFIDFGRGSVAGSIVSWCLGISGCDPIRYNLFFSRFLNKARAKSKKVGGDIWIDISLALDIDINLGDNRDEIVKWLKEIYPNRICKVSNVSTLTGKILIKDVFKVLENAKEDEAKDVADLIERRFGVVADIGDIYTGKKDENGRVIIEQNSQFKEWADEHQGTYNIALKLRDLIRQTSSHASGYLVSFDELTEHTPLCLDSDKQITSVYTMDSAQCLKLDLLGLETNVIIKNVLDNIPDRIDINKINLEDNPIIYDQFQSGTLLPYGLYQISADCAYKVCNNLKPKNVMELSHVNAIARPTALAYEKPYLENKATCPHPLLEKALNWTNFQPLYQEQTLMCLKAIGFDDVEAEMARRVWAKKKRDEVEEQVDKVKSKLEENKLPKEVGDVIIKLAEEGANYQFNLSHSLSTSYLTALTVYLKYKYPLYFYQACLNQAKNKPDFVDRLGQIYAELNNFNITLLPPHITKSGIEFKIENGNLRFALGSIKNISEKSIEKLKTFQSKEYQNKFNIFIAANQAGLNSAVMSSLILVGSLDDALTESRAKNLAEWDIFNLLTDNEKGWIMKLGEEYKYNLIDIVKALNEKILNDKGKPIIKDSRRLTIRKNFAPYLERFNFNKKNEQLANWWFERALLGFSYSTNLFDIYKSKVEDLTPIYEILGDLADTKHTFVCEVIEAKLGESKEKKTPYLRMDVKDHSGKLRIMIFNGKNNPKLDQCREINGGNLPKEGDICIISGTKKDGNTVFAERIGIQRTDVFLKISQLPKNQENVAEIS